MIDSTLSARLAWSVVQTFSMQAMVQMIYAQLDDDELQVKVGPRRHRVATAGLRHLYVESGGPMQLLWLSHETKAGKLERLSVATNAGDPGLEELVDALLTAYPHIDIRTQDRDQAMKTIGAISHRTRGLLSVALVLGVLACLTISMILIGSVYAQ